MRQLHNYCKWKPSVTRKKLWEKIPLQFHSLSTQKCWVINSWAFLEKSIHSFTTWALYKQMNTACLCLRVSCSLISNSEIPWTIARQTPLSMELSRQEYWSGLLFPSPRDVPDPGIKPRSPTLQADSSRSKPPEWRTNMPLEEHASGIKDRNLRKTINKYKWWFHDHLQVKSSWDCFQCVHNAKSGRNMWKKLLDTVTLYCNESY